jgi:glucosamine--fructose-6-phosphate aminotransferase (isomerizing)
VAISQSGETADTLAALHEVRRLGAHSLVVTNAAGSTLDRTCDASLLLRCGPEVGVASTKAFTTQVLVLLLLALRLAEVRGIYGEEHRRIAKALAGLPDLMREALGREPQVKALAASLASGASGFLFLGRDLQFPIALEGALKLKEISYINAQGYPAAEMKHGPIALVDRAMVVVVMAPQGRLFDKTRSNIQEVLARRGRVVVISDAAPNSFVGLEVTLHSVPVAEEALMPFLMVVPLQLLALRTAEAKGCDVDKPRNLAKSVTVE